MSISNSEKILIVKVGLPSREFTVVKCVLQWLGLILLVPIYYFFNHIGRKLLSRLMQLVFCKNNDLHYW